MSTYNQRLAEADTESTPQHSDVAAPARSEADAAVDSLESDLKPDMFVSRRRRKKYIKKRRKEARYLRKTELHSSAKCGRVGDEDRIVVPEYMVNAGYDIKFESDPSDMDLKGIMTPNQFFKTITILNEALSHARAKPVDFFLLSTSTLIPFALIAWAVRHRKHRKKHKKILVDFLKRFNDTHASRGIRMRWRRKPASELVIERFSKDAGTSASPQQ